MDEHRNFIIDYSVFDAISAGFDKVVFIIRKANEQIFKDTIGKRIGSRVDVEYVFQENDSVPDPRIPADRTKPLGTGHAILCCKDVVDDKFMIINADDFYGRGSFLTAADFIRNECSDRMFGCVCYRADRTLSENGKVKRGLCRIVDGMVDTILESSMSRTENDLIRVEPLNGVEPFDAMLSTPVSMHMFIFTHAIFPLLEKGFGRFLGGWKDPMKDEFLLPDIVTDTIESKAASVKCVLTDETWFGVTYPDDKPAVVKSIKEKIDCGDYPSNLWA